MRNKWRITNLQRNTRAKKRNKTGYNLFFSAYVEELKRTHKGVPSERGSCARVVGNAWKNLSAQEKQHYETEAEKENVLEHEHEDGKSSRTARKPEGETMSPHPSLKTLSPMMPPPLPPQYHHQPPHGGAYHHVHPPNKLHQAQHHHPLQYSHMSLSSSYH